MLVSVHVTQELYCYLYHYIPAKSCNPIAKSNYIGIILHTSTTHT